jgi:hypothetical protein
MITNAMSSWLSLRTQFHLFNRSFTSIVGNTQLTGTDILVQHSYSDVNFAWGRLKIKQANHGPK